MGYVLYVGFGTYRCATVKIRLYFKRLIFIQIFFKKKKKKKRVVTEAVRLPVDRNIF
jgi:hypothetical protein